MILFRVDSTMLTNSYSHFLSIHAVYCLVLPKLLCLHAHIHTSLDRRLLDVFNHDANCFLKTFCLHCLIPHFFGQTSFISKIVINCLPLKTNIQNK